MTETKQESKHWVEAGGSVPKKANLIASARKVMDSMFWDAEEKKAEQLQVTITLTSLTSCMSKFEGRGLAWRRKKNHLSPGQCICSQKCVGNGKNCRIWGTICLAIPPILPIWHPQTSISSQTRRNLFLESASCPMKNLREVEINIWTAFQLSLQGRNTYIGEMLNQVCWTQGRL